MLNLLPLLRLLVVGLASVQNGSQVVPVGTVAGGRTLLPNGQSIQPVGAALTFAGRPTDLALTPDGRTLILKDNRGLVVIDTAGWKLRQELRFPDGAGGSMHGVVVSVDGMRVYATTAQDTLAEAEFAAQGGTLAWKRQIALPGPKTDASEPCGIALSPDGLHAYVCLSRNNSLAVVDLQSGTLTATIPVGIAPWNVVLTSDGATAYVTDWGGRHLKPGDLTAKSAGTDTVIDARGVAASGCVSVVDLAQSKEIAQIATGLHPSDLKLSPDGRKLYVANANSDTLSVLDTQKRRVVETVPVHPDPARPFGCAPGGLALSPDGRTLYVAEGGSNTVAVVGLSDEPAGRSWVLGFVPTCWYPGAVAANASGLYVADVKGLGSRRRDPKAKGWSVYNFQGTAERIPLPLNRHLKQYTALVRQLAHIPAEPRGRAEVKPVPVPAHVGEPSVFKHVIYVIKENRTYDQVFGDLPHGNNDPSLVLFGRKVTPNHHALAEQFVLLDNFYCNGVNSADGHSWATEGNVTDHLEKSFGGFSRSYTFGDDPLTYTATGFVWDNALRHGLSVRNYGEMDYAEPVPSGSFKAIYTDYLHKSGKFTFTHSIGVENLRRHSSPDYPGWNLRIPDVLRADLFLRDLRAAEHTGNWPTFTVLYLPNDHTSGTSPGSPTPRAQVADNDLALGRVVEGLSHSRFWKDTCLFVVEDDAQDGYDHVDGHRSPALVISPYTRRGTVVSHFYNQTSVLHTMQRILGLPALNQMDGGSPLMIDCFTARPDLRPYTCVPNSIPLDEMNPPLKALRGAALHWVLASRRLRFDEPDEADTRILNRVLWYAMKQTSVPSALR